jgi:hypothetical protein
VSITGVKCFENCSWAGAVEVGQATAKKADQMGHEIARHVAGSMACSLQHEQLRKTTQVQVALA